MEPDSDDENLVLGGRQQEPSTSPPDPLRAGATMPQVFHPAAQESAPGFFLLFLLAQEMYETEWEAFQMSIQSPVGEPDLLELQDLGSDSTMFYQKNLPNLGFPQVLHNSPLKLLLIILFCFPVKPLPSLDGGHQTPRQTVRRQPQGWGSCLLCSQDRLGCHHTLLQVVSTSGCTKTSKCYLIVLLLL